MRDVQVEEFLRKLLVGVAAPSDLARSVIMKILYCGEGGDLEQEARTSKQFSHVCDCSSISLTYLCLISCMLFIVNISIYLILLVLNRYTNLGCLISSIIIIVHTLHA